MSNETIIDIRPILPKDRHPLIFNQFESLASGESFILINDHNPKPLYYQFQTERTGQFTWTYLEQDTDTWRVRIGRS